MHSSPPNDSVIQSQFSRHDFKRLSSTPRPKLDTTGTNTIEASSQDATPSPSTKSTPRGSHRGSPSRPTELFKSPRRVTAMSTSTSPIVAKEGYDVSCQTLATTRKSVSIQNDLEAPLRDQLQQQIEMIYEMEGSIKRKCRC